MPFTLAHPAAVLPIHSRYKKWLLLPPLVIGSMVPDASYYVPMPNFYKENAHTALGAFWFSLPAGMVALIIFYWIAPELAFLLPGPHREMLQPKIKVPSSLWEISMAALGIVLGAETHVLWDSCTHKTGWMVQRIPLLLEPLWGPRMPIYQALQYLTTLLGFCVILYAYDRSMAQAGFQIWAWRRPTWRFYLWTGVLCGCLLAAIVESRTVHAIISFSFLYSKHFGLILITSFVRDFLIALCVLSIGVKLIHRYAETTLK